MLHEISLRISTTKPMTPSELGFFNFMIIAKEVFRHMHGAPSEKILIDQQADFRWQSGEEDGFAQLRAVVGLLQLISNNGMLRNRHD
jgi:hypothetical protein